MNLSPLPIQKFFDNNGRPLAGGLLFTYEAGTSIKTVTYKDSSGGTPNTNPIALDFRGECRLWIDPLQAYKFVLSPRNDTDPPTHPIWTVDDITAAPQAFDNAAVDTGSVNNISLSVPQISSPVLFTRVVFEAANTNTAATTIQINGGTALPLIFPNGDALTGGEIQADGIYQAIFDGGSWQFQGLVNLGDYRHIIRALGFETAAPLPGSIAQFYSREAITAHAHYAFLDEAQISYVGGGTIGHASFNANPTFAGNVASDHHHSFQSVPHYGTTATISRISSFYSIPDITAGTVTELSHFRADNPTGAGTITNQYGAYIAPLTRASGNNYAFFSEGQTKSCLGGDLQLGTPSTPATVRYEYGSGNLELEARSTFKVHAKAEYTLFGASAEVFCASIRNNASTGNLEITPRSTFKTIINGTGCAFLGPVQLPSYTVATVPAAATWATGMIYVSNESGGAVPAFSDAVNWRRVTDRAIIS